MGLAAHQRKKGPPGRPLLVVEDQMDLIHFLHGLAAALGTRVAGTSSLKGVALDADIAFRLFNLGFGLVLLGVATTGTHTQPPG